MTRTARGIVFHSPTPIEHDITVPLDEVAGAACHELTRTGVRGIGIQALFEDLLAGRHAELLWAGDGFGKGIEIRRSISGLFGRFFARWFAENYLSYRFLTPISGSPFAITGRMSVVRRPGQKRDLPDWIGIANGQCCFCEAKGSSANHISASNAYAALNTAKDQIANGRVRMARSRRHRQLGGWGIMSRWGTEDPYREPLIIARDPDPEENPLSADEHRELGQALRRLEAASVLSNIGLLKLATEQLDLSGEDRVVDEAALRSAIVGPPAAAPYSARSMARDQPEIAEVETVDGTVTTIGRLVTVDGTPLDLSAEDAIAQAGLDQFVFFIGIDKRELAEKLVPIEQYSEPSIPTGERRSAPRGGLATSYVSHTGFVVARLSRIKHTERYAPQGADKG